MNAVDLLDQLRDSGVEVWCSGGRVMLRPARLVTSDLADQVRASKPALIRLLQAGTRVHTRAARVAVAMFDGEVSDPRELELTEPARELEPGELSLGEALAHVGRVGTPVQRHPNAGAPTRYPDPRSGHHGPST